MTFLGNLDLNRTKEYIITRLESFWLSFIVRAPVFFSYFIAAVCIFCFLPYLIPLTETMGTVEELEYDKSGEIIDVDGYKGYVIDKNPNSSKVIVFIHGFGGSTYTWRDIMPKLEKEGYRVVAIDLKGFGMTEKLENTSYDHASQAQYVNRVLQIKNIPPGVFICHSMGANVTFHFASLYPEKVTNIIAIDGALVPVKPANSEFNFLLRYQPFSTWVRVIAKHTISKYTVKEVLYSAFADGERVPANLVEEYSKPLLLPNWEDAVVGFIRDIPRNTINLELVPEKNGLVIWGEKDEWITLENSKVIAEKLNANIVIVKDSGHLPMEEYPKETYEIILKYLKSLEPENHE